MKKLVLLSVGVSIVLCCCRNKEAEEIVAEKPAKEQTQTFQPNFYQQKTFEVNSTKNNNGEALARLGPNDEVVYLRSENAYSVLLLKLLDVKNQNDPSAEVSVKAFSIEQVKEGGPFYLFGDVGIGEKNTLMALPLEIRQSTGNGGVFIVNGGPVVVLHSCTGDGCDECTFETNSKGEVTGCDCSSDEIFGGICNHKIEQVITSAL